MRWCRASSRSASCVIRRCLPRCHRLAAVAERATLPRLHFDEHDRLAVARDDVHFSTTSAVAPRKNCVPSPFELGAREIFAGFPKSDAGLRHAHGQQTSRRNATAITQSTKNSNSLATSRSRDLRRRRVRSTSVSASSKIRTAVSACSRVSTSGGEKRTAFFPAPEHQQSAVERRRDDRVALGRSRAPWSADRAPARRRSSARARARRR